MNDAISVEEYQRLYGAKKKRNKYNVAPPEQRTCDGKTYASKAEMEYATLLWLQYNAGQLLLVLEQPRLWLGIRDNVYVPDFMVVATVGGTWFVDVKGKETSQFAKVRKLWAKYARLPLHIVTVKSNRWHAEIIQPGGRT